NNNEILRCTGGVGRPLCEANYYPERYSPIYLAETVGTTSAQGITDQYFQDGSFVKFRELSATYLLPARFLRGASSASVTVAARELHTWTKYRGLDPEDAINIAATTATLGDQAVMPPVSRFVLS